MSSESRKQQVPAVSFDTRTGLYVAGEFQGAIDDMLNHVHATYPGDTAALMQVGHVAVSTGRVEEAHKTAGFVVDVIKRKLMPDAA